MGKKEKKKGAIISRPNVIKDEKSLEQLIQPTGPNFSPFRSSGLLGKKKNKPGKVGKQAQLGECF